MCREKKGIGMIKSNKGFTLMELIIVMSILAVLVTLALLYYGNVGQDAYRNALMADLKATDQAIALYENQYGALPVVESAIIDLEDEVTASTGVGNVPLSLKVNGAIDAYTIDATNANFMAYIKKTTYLLKGVESGDIRGAGKLFYIDAVDNAAAGDLAALCTGTTIVLDTGCVATDDIYNGCTINITSGAGVGQSRLITDYVGASKTATISSALADDPAAGDDYVIKAPVKAGDIVFLQTATSSKQIIKDSAGAAIYKY